MSDPGAILEELAQQFADRIMARVAAVLEGDPPRALVDSSEDRFWLRSEAPGFPLRVRGRTVGHLEFEFAVTLDHLGKHLKVNARAA